MRRVIISLLTMVLSVACDKEENIRQEHNFDALIANFRDLYKTGLQFQVSNLKEHTSVVDGKIRIDHDGLNRKTMDQLNSKYFLSAFDPGAVLGAMRRAKSNDLRTDYYDDGIVLSPQAQVLVEGYFNEMSYVSDPYSAYYVVQNYQNQAIYSPGLTYDDQVQLTSVIQAGGVMSDYFFSGYAARDIGAVLEGYGQQVGDMGTCRVNWRMAWISASVGFFAGAASGAYVGATGGTVALPGIGTVTGGVAGAVFGGAGGFVGGFVTGVATELLGTCFREAT